MAQRISGWIQEFFWRRRGVNATRIVAASFAVIILLGTLLLSLPAASRSGESAGLFPALFTATSSTCVTGLVLVDTGTQWSLFGQAVILVMIQLGGLGFMTVVTLLSLALRRKISMSERLVMASTLNLQGMDGVVRVVRHALMGTFLMEGAGALILSTRFIPEFGLAGGLWRGIFHAVSGFCNAGFDLLGGTYGPFCSIAPYRDDPVVLGTLMALVVIGGLGFFVWEDILTHRKWNRLSLYSRMVLGLTGGLLLFGTVFFLWTERANPATLGAMPAGERLLNAAFQSVTLRTAGFATLDQGALGESSKVFSCILMLIGGSSGSTAGGLKTVTVGVLLLALRAGLAGREQVTLRGWAVPDRRVLDAMNLTLMAGVLFLVCSLVVSVLEGAAYVDCAFEVASAMATVGLSANLTPELSVFSQGVLIALMYLGRVGILSFSIAFLIRRDGRSKIRYPEVDLMIG